MFPNIIAIHLCNPDFNFSLNPILISPICQNKFLKGTIQRTLLIYCLFTLRNLLVYYRILDYGNPQLTNQYSSFEVTIFVSYLFRGNIFAALQHFSYAYWPWQPRLQLERRCACGRQTELLERFFLTKNQVLGF